LTIIPNTNAESRHLAVNRPYGAFNQPRARDRKNDSSDRADTSHTAQVGFVSSRGNDREGLVAEARGAVTRFAYRSRANCGNGSKVVELYPAEQTKLPS
jgi:hypothetical protein